MAQHANIPTNHGALSTAIRYAVQDNAPIIVAKGKNELAQKILSIAKQHNITVVHSADLAQRVFELDIATEIPEELYEIMAQILSSVVSIVNRTTANHATTKPTPTNHSVS